MYARPVHVELHMYGFLCVVREQCEYNRKSARVEIYVVFRMLAGASAVLSDDARAANIHNTHSIHHPKCAPSSRDCRAGARYIFAFRGRE